MLRYFDIRNIMGESAPVGASVNPKGKASGVKQSGVPYVEGTCRITDPGRRRGKAMVLARFARGGNRPR